MGGTLHDAGTHVIEITEVRHELLADLADRLCAADQAELEAHGWSSPLESLKASVDCQGSYHEAYMAWWEGKPQAVFGVVEMPDHPTIGVPWMLSTGPRGRVCREFLKVSTQYVSAWSQRFERMFNFVDARHYKAHLWLLHLGFSPMKIHFFNGLPFIEFGIHQ